MVGNGVVIVLRPLGGYCYLMARFLGCRVTNILVKAEINSQRPFDLIFLN